MALIVCVKITEIWLLDFHHSIIARMLCQNRHYSYFVQHINALRYHERIENALGQDLKYILSSNIHSDVLS